jgi:hypothetical protein
MRELLIKNRKAAVTISLLAGFLLLSTVLQACQLQDLIKIDVPPAVAEAVQTEERVSVADSGEVWEEWVAWVDRQSDRLQASIGEGQERLAMVESLTSMGISLGQDAASTLPGGALISTGLALMGGLFLKRPGDKKREQMEKEASYRAGLDKGQRIAQGVKDGIEALRGHQEVGNGPEGS